MPKYYLGLGGNIGAVEDYMLEALYILQQKGGKIQALSSVYKTPPWGVINQDWFLNACLCLHIKKNPQDVLLLIQDIEAQLKRKRDQKWGPRTLDIDILAIQDNPIYQSETLQIPHPFLTDRAFVLAPLVEIAPYLRVKGQTIYDWYLQRQDPRIIKLPVTKKWANFQV